MNERKDLRRIVDRFLGEGDTFVAPFGNGLINRSFLIERDGEKYTLQEINTGVFSRPILMMDNIVKVTDHVGKKSTTVRPLRATDGNYYVDDGGFYRLMTYVDGEVKESITSPDDMEVTGKGFGLFQHYLTDFPYRLHDTIPDFHNTPVRYANFLKSVKKADLVSSERIKNCSELIEGYLSLSYLNDTVVAPLNLGLIPTRVTHNDTKINNLVTKNGEPVCAIDLDTVMSGSICYDFGDAIRSGGCTVNEDGVDPLVDLEYYEAFCKGFFSVDLSVTEKEKSLLPLSPALMTYECGLRFLTDYLDGDIYFSTRYPDHNLRRAENQFHLVSDMLKRQSELTQILNSFF